MKSHIDKNVGDIKRNLPDLPLPNFIIGGVGKAGTTSLYHYLRQHPEIYLTPIKETNFFASEFIDFENLRPDVKASRALDVASFVEGPMEKMVFGANVRNLEHYMKLFKNVRGEKAIGEVNPNYFVVPESFKKMSALIPDAKQVLVLRNPVDRAFSSFVMHFREGRESERNFLKAVKADQNRSLKGWGISFNYLYTGLYSEKLKILFDHYPEGQIRIYLLEDFKRNYGKTLRDLFSFLEVDPDFQPNLDKRYNVAAAPRFPALNRFFLKSGFREWARRKLPDGLKKWALKLNYSRDPDSLPKLDSETRSILLEFFEEDIDKTSDMIGRDLSHWKSGSI